MANPSRILITGSTGFVGRYLLDACHARYPEATLFGIASRPFAQISSSVQRELHLDVADITDARRVQQIVARVQPDLVFHLAAQSSVAASWKDPLGTLRINVEGTMHLLDALRQTQLVPRILLIGSGEQYGMIQPSDNPIREECPFRPANPYAASKAAQDLYGYQYFVAYGLPILRVRAFNHFGPYQPATFVISSFARQIAQIEAGKAEPVLAVGNLTARRDFLPVEDVINAYLAIAERGHAGAAYNVGSGQARSIRSILDLLLSSTDKTIQIHQDPARQRPVDVPLLEANTSRVRADTGWQPSVRFEDALRQTLDYWRTVVSAE